jgi:alkylation response protein AidB-like acyl-CoA dehydrogenase
MNFDFTEEQLALQDTVRRFVARDYTFEKRRAIRDAAPGWSREVWQALADLGVLAINIDEDTAASAMGRRKPGW